MTVPVLQALAVSKRYGDAASHRLALPSMDIAVAAGEIVGVSGPSGSGKTTLGDILLGILPSDTGTVFWNGRALAQLSAPERRRLRPRFAKLYQDPAAAFPAGHRMRSLFDDLIAHAGPSVSTETLLRHLERLHLHPDVLRRDTDSLSGGELQRLALARALLFKPLFLVADEPTSRLDPSVQAVVARQIRSIAAQDGMGVLFISHDRTLLQVIADRVVTMPSQDSRPPP